MIIVLAFIFFLIGISFGSFFNVVADRVPQRKSIVSPPSHCFQCGHPIESKDLIPVFSYLALRGHCRYCGAGIPLRSMLVELTTGLLFVLAWVVLGPQWQLPVVLLYMSILIILSITDLESAFLPGIILYPAVAVALIITLIKTVTGLSPDIVSAAIGFGVGFGLFFLIWCIARLFKRSYWVWRRCPGRVDRPYGRFPTGPSRLIPCNYNRWTDGYCPGYIQAKAADGANFLRIVPGIGYYRHSFMGR